MDSKKMTELCERIAKIETKLEMIQLEIKNIRKTQKTIEKIVFILLSLLSFVIYSTFK